MIKTMEDKRTSSSFLKTGQFYKLLQTVIIMQTLIIFLTLFQNVWLSIFILLIFGAMDTILWRYSRKFSDNLNLYISNLSYKIKRGEHEAIIKLPVGIVIYNELLEVEWLSPYLQTAGSSGETIIGKKLKNVFPGIEMAIKEEDPHNKIIKWNNEYYKISLEKDINSIYFENVTAFVGIQNKLVKNQSVVGWLFLDNYDEIKKGLDDRAISNLNSLLTTYLSNWARQHNIYYKRTDDDKYLLLLRYEELERLETEKFNIVNSIREYTSKRNLPLTISVGISYGAASFIDLANRAQKDLDLALGRGGDQAIVRKVNEEPRYYGGTTNPMEKRTRVRSRMISEALQEQIRRAPVTYVVGHQYPDMDAIGSSLGIARIAMMLEKECRVIIDTNKIGADGKKLLEKIKNYKETYNNIITPEQAMKEIQTDDLLVMVDHHKPSMSIAENIDKKTKNVVIIDHHRRGDEFPDEPVLVYIEPYASSASELITELFEYVSTDTNTINRIEATSMLAGIIVDTNNFTLRTGTRTFDAASYLQSVGANTITIQRILKEKPENYIKRMKIIDNFEFITEGIAIAIGDEKEFYSQVLAAQTADTMLSMTGVEAAIVVIRLNEDRIGMSARSLGEINVQRIMEELDGGGHLTNAATQIQGKSLSKAREDLIKVIKELSN